MVVIKIWWPIAQTRRKGAELPGREKESRRELRGADTEGNRHRPEQSRPEQRDIELSTLQVLGETAPAASMSYLYCWWVPESPAIEDEYLCTT